MSAATTTAPGTWRILGRAWPWMLAAVLGNAAAQALLILGQPATALDPGFVLRVIGSLLALAVAGWVLSVAAESAAEAARFQPRRPARAVWAGSLALAAAASWIVSPFIVPFVLVVGLLLMPTGADGTIGRALGVVRRHPWRTVLAAILTILFSVVAWVVGLICGFFVTGPLGTFLAWLFAGAVTAIAIAMWTALHHR